LLWEQISANGWPPARSETLLKPDVMARLLTQTQAGSGAKPRTENADLTEREIEVLQAAAQVLRGEEIAVQLGISERTSRRIWRVLSEIGG